MFFTDKERFAPNASQKIILFGKSKNNKIKVWEGDVEVHDNGTASTVVHYGYLDGAKQEARKHVKSGKNLGKSNATTAVEQAWLNLESMANKKRDEGYNENVENCNSVLLPMLAQSYNEHPHRLRFPAYIQPKLNGVRCLAEVVAPGVVTYTSRKGKKFETLYSFSDTILKHCPVSTILDGEIYNHNLTLNQIVSRIKRVIGSRDDIQEDPVKFHVYDMAAPGVIWTERFETLKAWFGDSEQDVFLVETELVHNADEIKEFHSKKIEEGYEGSMLRNIDGDYEANARSYNLMKNKDFLEAEFEIIGGYEGEGKEEGQVIFRCKTADGSEFSVRPKGTASIRRAWFNDLDNIVGKQLSVRFQEWTEFKVPFHARGIEIRDYE